MRSRSIIAATGLLLASAASAAPLDQAAVDAAPQHYVMTLPQTPVAEVAEEVLGQTLGLPVTVDPRVDARMTFRVDGVYSPKALAREFGYQLWNVDVALIEDRSNALVLIPSAALAEAVAQGAEVVSPLALQSTSAVPAAGATSSGVGKPIVYGDRRGLENGWLVVLALVAGWIGGLSTPRLIRAWRARRGRLIPAPQLRLTSDGAGQVGPAQNADLVETVFVTRGG